MSDLLFNHALISLNDLKGYVNAIGSGADERLENAINEATLLIEERVGRELCSRGDSATPPTITEYHTINPADQFYDIYVSQTPVVSVTTLHEDDSWPRVYGAGALLVEGTDFEVNVREGIIRRLGSGGPMLWKSGSRIIKLVYKAGYRAQDGTPSTALSVPADLKYACKFIAASVFNQTDRKTWGISAQTDPMGTVTRFLGVFTPELDAILARYRRIEFHRTWERAA